VTASVLARWWGIENATLSPAPGGFTNTTWLVDAPAGRHVLRRSWPGKPAARADAEERVLAALADAPVPRIVPTRDGAPHVRLDDATLHLFTRIDGEPGPRWLDGDVVRATAVMTTLAHLHRTLAGLEVSNTDHWAHLEARLARVRAGRLDALPDGASGVLEAVEQALQARIDGDVQWLHGDVHLGNILWRGTEVAGVVDFDDVGTGSVRGEVAMAAFAIARRPGDDRFSYDAALWRSAIAAYEAVAGPIGVRDEPALARVFCASQVLVHLEAAQRGLWALEPGIGFWSCWHALRE
jgi:Ser/Thr protein kinase RdoA (MazF antagonist)